MTTLNSPELENWLKKATCQLSADSVAQVRTEIREHFESARQEALTTGASPVQAEHSALAALGSPSVANREYRKVLLTQAEARLLRQGDREVSAICSRPWLKRTLAAVPLTALAAAIALQVIGERELARTLLMGAVAIGFLVLAPFLPIYTAWRGRVYRTLKWTLLAGMFVVAADPKWLALMLPCLWPVAWIEWTRMSIRRKTPVSRWPRQLYL